MGKNDLLYAKGERSEKSLTRLQSLPLEQKINLSKRRIEQFYNAMNGKVSISFSGGKDSTVLLDIVRRLFPEVPAVFFDTGLEWPEIRAFVKTVDNVHWMRPKIGFREVIEKWGYPLPSKKHAENIYRHRTTKNLRIKKEIETSTGVYRKMPAKWRFLLYAPFKCSHLCCNELKKKPAKEYEISTGRAPYIGTMASESRQRAVSWINYGCNIFNGDRPQSHPLSFWNEKDIWEYIKKFQIGYSKIYDLGYSRTGCCFCLFGYFQEKEESGFDKFERMKETHPKMYKYCMNNLGLREVINYCKIKLGYEGEVLQPLLFDKDVETYEKKV